jgi:hypothetical protein
VDNSNISLSIQLAKDHKFPHRDLTDVAFFLAHNNLWSNAPDSSGNRPVDHFLKRGVGNYYSVLMLSCAQSAFLNNNNIVIIAGVGPEKLNEWIKSKLSPLLLSRGGNQL